MNSFCVAARWPWTSCIDFDSDPIWLERLASSIVSLTDSLLVCGSASPSKSSVTDGCGGAGAGGLWNVDPEAAESPVPCTVKERPKVDDGTKGLKPPVAVGDILAAGDAGAAGLVLPAKGSFAAADPPVNMTPWGGAAGEGSSPNRSSRADTGLGGGGCCTGSCWTGSCCGGGTSKGLVAIDGRTWPRRLGGIRFGGSVCGRSPCLLRC